MISVNDMIINLKISQDDFPPGVYNLFSSWVGL